MALNGSKPSSARHHLTCDTKAAGKCHRSNSRPRPIYQTTSHFKQYLTSLSILIIFLHLSFSPASAASYNEDFLLKLPFQTIVSIGSESTIYTSQEFTRTCFAKINYKQMCAEYGPKCEFMFEWSYPESLLERIRNGFDARIRIQNELPITLKSDPDYQVYSSHLLIANTGYSHRGIWSCNFKFINAENGKLDSWTQTFNINIIENGVRGSPCLTDDHCSSFNCTNEECICDAEAPISVAGLCIKAPKLGENCRSDADCGINIEDAKCLCSSSSSEVFVLSSEIDDQCTGRKICQCPPSYLAVNLGLGQYRCLKKARLNEHCYRSQQCEIMDPSTYCSFKSRCTCRSGQKCVTQSIRLCSTKSDCNINEYCGNGRCQTVKDLNEACLSSDECETNARCSQSICVCSPGYKLSPVKMTCIPKDVCYNDLDCDHGFCNDNATCIQGVPLLGHCYTTKQCQALDENSYCDGDTSQCACGPDYTISSQEVCLLNGKCRVHQDCIEDENGLCYYEECIYTKQLNSICQESRQCFLSTRYSYCNVKGSHGRCDCLNGKTENDNTCPQWKQCETNDHCANIINSYCDWEKSICTCNDGYILNIDGNCYKKSLTPSSDSDSFWIKIWNDYYIYIIIGSVICGFLIALILCCCCKLCKPTDQRRRPNRRDAFEQPVSGVYIPNPPSAPPPPYEPSTISRNF